MRYICRHDLESIFERILILVKHAERANYILNLGTKLQTDNFDFFGPNLPKIKDICGRNRKE